MTRVEAVGNRSAFPVILALDALHAWFIDPSEERRASLGDALRAIVEVAGARGAHVVIDAPPLPSFRVGFGTLVEPPDQAGEGIVAHRLSADDGRVPLGTLWLDAAGDDGTIVVRALELALDAAWARASVHATTERLRALDVATRAISEVLDVDRVLQLIVDRVRDLVRARYAALGIVDSSDRIERFVTSGLTPEERARIGDPPRGHGLLGLIIRENRSIRIPDISAHPDSYGFPPNHPVMTSLLGVPIPVKGKAIGRFYLTDKIGEDEFSEDDQRLVETFALHAGIAIENARLHDQVQQLAVVEERDRIAKDLHDGIIQSLYAIALSLEDVPDLLAKEPDEAADRVDRAIDGLNKAIHEIRTFILGLRSELDRGGDVAAGLVSLGREFSMNTMIHVETDIDPRVAAVALLPVGHRVQLLQMAREALSNAGRHSRASRIRIALTEADGTVELRIEDDGIGFDPDAVRGPGHLGLRNLRARAAALDGTLTIDSEPGRGTRIIVTLPLPPAMEPPTESRHP